MRAPYWRCIVYNLLHSGANKIVFVGYWDSFPSDAEVGQLLNRYLLTAGSYRVVWEFTHKVDIPDGT